MNSDDALHLVMGVSSVGKSSYIQSNIASGVWADLPLVMAYELEKASSKDLLTHSCVIHYNLFRPYKNSAENLGNDLLADPVLTKLLNYGERIQAYLLIAHRSQVAKRCLLRKVVEPDLKKPKNPYPQQRLFELLCRVDWSTFYKQWFSLLRAHHIRFEIINSSGGGYSRIPSEEEAFALLGADCRAEYSSQEIDYIVKTNKFEYQQMELPSERGLSPEAAPIQPASSGRLAGAWKAAKRLLALGGLTRVSSGRTTGQDRSPMLKFLDADLTGKSVLDIGCAYGFFCFEAEDRHAARVVGTELKQHRFVGSNIFKEIYGKRTEFLRQDVFSHPLDEKFDVVLLLNVIHHLREPIKALRMIAELCNEKLIIEFPMLSDGKFQSTLSSTQEFDPSLPCIGVSLLSEKDQTFLFSKEAINRILTEHDRLFSRIEFDQSPTSPDRCVAICYK